MYPVIVIDTNTQFANYYPPEFTRKNYGSKVTTNSNISWMAQNNCSRWFHLRINFKETFAICHKSRDVYF